MPWKTADVDEHIEGLDAKQKEVWVSVANKALESCLADGRSTDVCEASAIRQANTVAKNVSESMTAEEALAMLFEFIEAAAEEAVESDVIVLTEKNVLLTEQAVGEDGTASILLIKPGWGSSGYYPAAVLERDGPKVYPRGSHMHLDHPTVAEEKARPEGSVMTLAAALKSDAQYRANGPLGPGLYADAEIFPQHRKAVGAMAPHIGVSIRAMGDVKYGEAEGRKGRIVEALTAAKSVDFVTRAGAGGQMLLESAMGDSEPSLWLYEAETKTEIMEVADVTEQEAQALREENTALKADLARLKEALLLVEARAIVASELASIDMPEPTRIRLSESLSNAPVIADGVLDAEAFKAKIKESVADEMAYLAKATGQGKIRGVGASFAGSPDNGNDLKESFRIMYERQGMSRDQAENLATLATSSR